MTARRNTKHGPHADIAMKLAARPCGMNAPELVAAGVHRGVAAGVLNNLVLRGRLQRVEGQRCNIGWPLHQHFLHVEHMLAWVALPMAKRPNLRLRFNVNAGLPSADGRRGLEPRQKDPQPQRDTWRRAPQQGSPLARAVPPKSAVTPCPTCAVDPRYQIDPATFKGGEFSRLGVGRYADDAASCAARAVR